MHLGRLRRVKLPSTTNEANAAGVQVTARWTPGSDVCADRDEEGRGGINRILGAKALWESQFVTSSFILYFLRGHICALGVGNLTAA